jgi:formamidopyrimidine-DNA glycosylase
MPELPEVESVLRQLGPRLEGRRIEAVVYDPQERFSALGGDVRRFAGLRAVASPCLS